VKQRRLIAWIVNRDEAERAVASDVFEECGFDPVVDTDYPGSLNFPESLAPSIIFLDMDLKGSWSGTSLTYALQDKFPDAALIVTSRKAPSVLPDRVQYLPKPWQPGELASKGKSALLAFNGCSAISNTLAPQLLN
jgi:hypothetical protein